MGNMCAKPEENDAIVEREKSHPNRIATNIRKMETI
jgi:hypothetical protein